MKKTESTIIFYAPNVYVGGGRVLLLRAIKELARKVHVIAILNINIKAELELLGLQNIEFEWVSSSLKSYIAAEFLLRRIECRDSKVFCFHGLPPPLSKSKNIMVYVQNRLIIEKWDPKGKTLALTFNILIQKLVWTFCASKIKIIFTQSNTMKVLTQKFLRGKFRKLYTKIIPEIEVLPFTSFSVDDLKESYSEINFLKTSDFIYPATAVPHKNHVTLIQAWILLAKEGVYPSLKLPLTQRDSNLETIVQDTNNQYGTKIQILNELSHSDCLVAIIKSKALIYVSLSESYGLPLVEASALNIPILASRLDYVKDVCNPQLVFDPLSAISIANSVKKFLAAPKFVRGKINDRLKDLCRAITN